MYSRVLLTSRLAPRIFVAALAGLIVAPGAIAQDAKTSGGFYDSFKNGPFSAEFSLGLEYDSNVSIIEIDASSAQSDYAALFDFGLSAKANIVENADIKIGYDFSQDIQFEVSAFDTQSHRLSAELSYDFGEIESGVSYQFVHSRLGGAGFLRMHRLSPFVAAYIADKKAYLRAAYVYADKDFIGRIDRDASANAGSIDAFYFMNGQNTFVIAGYRFQTEDAISSEFDFDSHNFKFRFVQRVPMGRRDGKLRLGWRFEDRNYESITPAISAIRDDRRHRVSASLEIPFNDIMYSEIEARHDDFSSNLASADFTQNILTVRIGGRL